MTQAVGVAILLKEEDITDVGCLDGLDIGQALVNIALFEPIGYNCFLLESLELQKQWSQRHCPFFRSTLISYVFCRLAVSYNMRWFKECWTRSRYDEGYPQYRTHPEAASQTFVDADERLPNVYVSLVMNREEFRQINPDVQFLEIF